MWWRIEQTESIANYILFRRRIPPFLLAISLFIALAVWENSHRVKGQGVKIDVEESDRSTFILMTICSRWIKLISRIDLQIRSIRWKLLTFSRGFHRSSLLHISICLSVVNWQSYHISIFSHQVNKWQLWASGINEKRQTSWSHRDMVRYKHVSFVSSGSNIAQYRGWES